MQPRTPPGKGSHWVIDTAQDVAATVTHATITGVFFVGTVWPLLPDTSYKIFHASLNFVASVDEQIELEDMGIQISLLDSAGNQITELVVAAGNYTRPTMVTNSNGVSIESSGDPLTEFFSAMLSTGNPLDNSPIAQFQLQYWGDFKNLDATNDHTVTGFAATIFSSLP